jgi:leader peptidase (prepilin peptidase)/N-methyltransferase
VTASICIAVCAPTGFLVGWFLPGVIERIVTRRGGRDGRVNAALVAPLTAGLFGAMAWRFGASWQLPGYLLLSGFAVVLCFVDLGTKTLPRRLVYATGGGGVALLALPGVLMGELARLGWLVLGTLLALIVLWLLHAAARGAFGFGDVRFGAVLAGYVAWQGLSYVPVAILLAFVLSALVGLVLLIVRRAGRRTAIPFGPFLAAAALGVILLSGSSIGDGAWHL